MTGLELLDLIGLMLAGCAMWHLWTHPQALNGDDEAS